ncbi:MAG: hypothetical protein ACD_12C00613G0007 [uncultured bacterium]|nr:MAG: hypothetical protein ACD_12C00613G0007 [uncultured bacterium]
MKKEEGVWAGKIWGRVLPNGGSDLYNHKPPLSLLNNHNTTGNHSEKSRLIIGLTVITAFAAGLIGIINFVGHQVAQSNGF